MKIQINKILSNPFKSEINKGKLNEETIKKIKSNIKELGLMGALPVFKKNNQYFLVAGHHRLEALKQEFGRDYEVNVEVHDYNEEQVLRGMVVENLTQRDNDLKEELENLEIIINYLKKNKVLIDKHPDREIASPRHIYDWLNLNNNEIMKYSKINQYVSILKNLSPKILENLEKQKSGIHNTENITIAEAVAISKFSPEEQIVLAEQLKESKEGNKVDRLQLISEYNQAPQEVKEKIIKKDINLDDIKEAVVDSQINNNEKTEFIPNFDQRIKGFSLEVTKLQQQVAIFKKLFYSPNFNGSYKKLSSENKLILDNSIDSINNRIKNCYEEVSFFMKKIEEAKNE